MESMIKLIPVGMVIANQEYYEDKYGEKYKGPASLYLEAGGLLIMTDYINGPSAGYFFEELEALLDKWFLKQRVFYPEREGFITPVMSKRMETLKYKKISWDMRQKYSPSGRQEEKFRNWCGEYIQTEPSVAQKKQMASEEQTCPRGVA